MYPAPEENEENPGKNSIQVILPFSSPKTNGTSLNNIDLVRKEYSGTIASLDQFSVVFSQKWKEQRAIPFRASSSADCALLETTLTIRFFRNRS
jgi:hypothetical protein